MAGIPIVYGSKATPFKKPEGDNTHSWTVYVKIPEPVKAEDVIKRVTFKLHESFATPLRGIVMLSINYSMRLSTLRSD